MTVCSDMKNSYIVPAMIIAAVIFVGFWMLKLQKSPDGLIHDAAKGWEIVAIKRQLAAGTYVNVEDKYGETS